LLNYSNNFIILVEVKVLYYYLTLFLNNSSSRSFEKVLDDLLSCRSCRISIDRVQIRRSSQPARQAI